MLVIKLAQRRVASYLPWLAQLLHPDTCLAAPESGFPNVALTTAPFCLCPSRFIQVFARWESK